VVPYHLIVEVDVSHVGSLARWTAIFAQDLGTYNAKNFKQESVRILAAPLDDANNKCTVCPNKDTRMMRVWNKFAFRAASFISGHVIANNQGHFTHKYAIEKAATTKCEINTVEEKFAKAMMCS
jgi:hypothetical protein